MVKLHTNYGIITLELDAEKAPITVKNFLEYVNSGFYYKTLFHRVADGFVIQAGGYNYSLGTVSMSSITKMALKSPNPGRQRPQERQVHHLHGALIRAPLRHVPVLHQPQGQ
jgi:cyclophilin family peptidyl-prolyl cis-trans isomerase